MRIDSLRQALERYQPADAREAGFRLRMLELTQAEAACARSLFQPGHFTASAFLLSPDREELLLIHHRKLGIWVQPGGHIDAEDADAEAAARREVSEEVGLTELTPLTVGQNAIFDIDVHAIPAHKQELAHEHFDVRFAFVCSTRAFTRSEEVADARWVPLAGLAELGTDESVLRAARKLQNQNRF